MLYRDPHRHRAYRVRRGQLADRSDTPAGMAPGAVQVPLVGRIAAGAPILAEEVVEDLLLLPRNPRRARDAGYGTSLRCRDARIRPVCGRPSAVGCTASDAAR
ncbi:hypothetical protein [Streptomyces sp. KS 21]|uniref:LexA family protein n=1 Tax=Streptomyces sp. KS 21 TaxID=2485150 RepID=UPI001FB954BB|nr:hypothetical protein [Streptomyces sp. KS 21]